MMAVLNFFQYAISFLLVLSVIVILHEFGHFIVARLCGVQVVDFSFGFGKELFGWTDKRNTRWKMCLIPLGGYVKMLGDEDAASASNDLSGLTEEQKSRSFAGQVLWKKAAIIFAGPFMNYFSAVVLMTGIFFHYGDFVIPPVVGGVEPNYPAAVAGLQKGDLILSVNNQKIEDFSEVARFVRLSEGDVSLQVKRGEKEMSFTLKTAEKEGVKVIGVTSSVDVQILRKDLSLTASFVKSVRFAYEMTADTLVYLGQVLTGNRSPKEMRGPLGIAEASGDASKEGGISLLLLIVQISIGVGLMNLLPIPVLDGGHLFLFAVEGIIRRPLNEKVQTILMNMGLFILLSLFVWTILQDVPRILTRIFG